MVVLPVFIFCVALVKTCLGSEHTTVSPVSATEKIACPGSCVQEDACSIALNDTDCDGGLVCCVDQDESITSTEYADLTTEDSFGYSSPAQEEYEEIEAEGEEQVDDHTVSYSYTEEGSDEEDLDYTYVFSEESDTFTLRRSGEVADNCPGTCVPVDSSSECQYVIFDEVMCGSGSTCCLTEDDIRDTSDQFTYFIADETSEGKSVKRDGVNSDSCPGICVHPSHAFFCEQILPEFSCPLNTKCCIKRSSESSQAIECTGHCLPLNIQGYCFPPNELIMGPTTCKSGTTCCMQRSPGTHIQPPSVGTMQYPAFQYEETVTDLSQIVVGHLAVDEEGTVFKVGTDGQIDPLPRLARSDHLGDGYNKLMEYPLSYGNIVIYSDGTGSLYQQLNYNGTKRPYIPFDRERLSFWERAHDPKRNPRVPRGVPTEDERSLNIHHALPNFFPGKKSSKRKPSDTEKEGNLQDPLGTFPEEIDVIIPEDEDPAPIVDSKPSVVDRKISKPACPGSCISYFLRFTCFRGYAVSDNFYCPRPNMACCAKVADIEENEKRLRSLSPLSKESLDSEKTVPKCGIKGRNDSQPSAGVKDSLPGEWCWQVAILDIMNQYVCSGVLIGDTWVLTAAHCVAGLLKARQAIFVRAGVTDLKYPEDNSKVQTIRVGSTFIHHDFKSRNLDNNIALLQLQKPVDLNDNVCVVCLPTSGEMPTGNVNCTVTGYGFIDKEKEMPLKLREVQVPFVDDTECMANVTEALDHPYIIPASSFCAAGEGREGDCQGDSGGSLTCDIDGIHELVGLVSWSLGCGVDNLPTIYVKVPAFMGWINTVLVSVSYLTALN